MFEGDGSAYPNLNRTPQIQILKCHTVSHKYVHYISIKIKLYNFKMPSFELFEVQQQIFFFVELGFDLRASH
jgi:hypothetical protein